MRPGGSLDDAVLDVTDASRGAADDVARLQEPRRRHECATPCRSTGAEDVARIQPDDGAEPLDRDIRQVELIGDQLALTKLSVDIRLDSDLADVRDLVPGHDAGTHGAERVEVLAQIA